MAGFFDYLREMMGWWGVLPPPPPVDVIIPCDAYISVPGASGFMSVPTGVGYLGVPDADGVLEPHNC